MEIRKLQKTGGSSLTLTLPKKWTQRFSLGDKDTVVTHPQSSGALTIVPQQVQQTTLSATLTIEGLTEEMMKREIVAHYIAGIDEITIVGDTITASTRTAVRTIAQSLVGFEIIDESSQAIILKNIFDASKFSVYETIGKMYRTVLSMVDDALKSVAEHNRTLAQDVVERDTEIDKWQLAIWRQVTTLMRDRLSEEEVGLDAAGLSYYHNVAMQLERIADHAVKVANLVSTKQQEAMSSRLVTISGDVVALLHHSRKMALDVDKRAAHQVIEMTLEVEKKLYKGVTKNDAMLETIVRDSLDRWRGYLMNIAELTIDYRIFRESVERTE